MAGVKIGSGSWSLSTKPAGSLTPQTLAVFLIFFPARAGQITAHHALDWHNFGLADQDRPPNERLKIDYRRQIKLIGISFQQMIRLAQKVEPKIAHLRQHPTLVGDACGQHPIVGANPVAADQQQPVAQVPITEIIDIADFAAPEREAG